MQNPVTPDTQQSVGGLIAEVSYVQLYMRALLGNQTHGNLRN